MKWGIMATGSIAQKFASTVNRMTDEGEILQAVASRTKESAENFARQHRIPEVFDSYKAMAESDSVDVIYIATPNNMHYENVKMCLLAGKHVLCEKPFTTSVAQAQELYALAEEKGLFLMEGFWIRFLPVLQKMQGLSNKEIAEKTFLSEGTIRNYISTVLEKLNLRDRTQLAVFYYQNGGR